MKALRPEALRLVTRAEGAKSPKPPFGLRGWSPTATAVAVLLDGRSGQVRSVAAVAAQLPLASSLAPGTPLVVLGTAAARGSFWRWFARGAAVPRGERCSALLARGYVDIGGGVDPTTGTDLAWGYSTLQSASASLVALSSRPGFDS